MSEFRANCERFLATTRQHFFAGDRAIAFQSDLSGGPAQALNSETHPRAHTGK
ncbi:hypothetical protein [Accumulibacter sp.]|uniref:hypothetical protein n=1 Tax=Accumulibacter sp. TaxID=2053492 RepID=UPI00262ED2F2|nr:hypothetical protein [Accumulibacter sp.]